MRELVFLLEEESAAAMLKTLLPRMLNPGITPRYMPFEGKQDLEKQLPKRLKGYLNPNARFIVLRDQDRDADCKALKARLATMCAEAGRCATSSVRIACRELEAFYLADLEAVGRALGIPNLDRHQRAARFRSPDTVVSPSSELAKLCKQVGYKKVGDSRKIGAVLSIDNERSPSFRNLLGAIRRHERELLALPDSS
ncbi:DUF4276 family protein [Variovorax robiniae]|uniref:DUF4276 family protein n=1 Tax=Variovorax robiniae TaxID=1836199 RepID=A0ABU8X5H3_9BURK